MPPHCVFEPLECNYQVRSLPRLKRAVPPPATVVFSPPAAGAVDSSSTEQPSAESDKALIISAAALGSLLLVISAILFYVCMKRRRASRRIGQLQEFLPTFMDEEKTESYFKQQQYTSASSATTLVPTSPSNVHHRTRSAPVAFAKGGKDQHKLRHLNRDGSVGVLHSIPLVPEETLVESEEESALKRSLSTGTRHRASTVAVPTTAMSSLHRSVSLNNHGDTGYISRTPPTEDEDHPQDPHDADALPTGILRFAEGERVPTTLSRGYSNHNRFSAGMEFSYHRSTPSTSSAVEFDPSRYSTSTVMFEAKHLSARTSISSDDDDSDRSSISSSDAFDHLPPHQKPQNFESHMVPNPYLGGDKQELEEEDEDAYYAPQLAAPLSRPLSVVHKRTGSRDSAPCKPAVSNGPPLPPRAMVARPHGGREMSLSADDLESEDDSHP